MRIRQLTTLHEAPQAHLFADYLHSLNIESRIDPTAEGWIIWIFDEDLLPRAREELQAFLSNPQDARFQKAARQLPRAAEEVDEPDADVEEPPVVPVLNIRLTASLILTSTLATILADKMNPHHAVIMNELLIATPGPEGFLQSGLPEVCHGQVWRLITPIFLHIGLFHLVVNMLWLHVLGRQIEQRNGSLVFAGLVILLAVLSNVGQYYFPEWKIEGGVPRTSPTPPFGGMSGVAFGLFGYVWLKSTFQSDSGLYIAPNTVILMLGWFFICTTGIVGNIANTAHGVGLITGMTIGYLSAWWNGWGPEMNDDEEPT